MTDYLQNKKVLVTGANGYLGNYILNALKQDYSIVVLDRRDFDKCLSSTIANNDAYGILYLLLICVSYLA
jgi:nucleoside-diphosphate-sugar epimerase